MAREPAPLTRLGHDASHRPRLPLPQGERETAEYDAPHSLHLELVDPAADRAALDELAEWCHRFAPSVGVEEAAVPESLLLDVTGLGRLCGGELALARRIVRAFEKRGLAAHVAIADTLAAAWAMAHFAELEIAERNTPENSGATAGLSSSAILSALAVPLIIPAGQSSAAIGPLPPAALRLPAETCALLADLGLERIAQVAALERRTLLARFGPLLLERLDQATGAAPEALVARGPSPEWLFEWPFEYPTGSRETIEWTAGQLVGQACQALGRSRRGIVRLECCFQFERRASERFVVGLYRPSASQRHVGDLVRLKLERVRFRAPVAAIRLRVLAIDRLEFRQREFFAGDNRESPGDLAALVDRLSNRLGPHAVVRPWLLAGAQPEFACQYRPAIHPLPSRERAGVRGRKTKATRKSRNAIPSSPLAGEGGPGAPGPGEGAASLATAASNVAPTPHPARPRRFAPASPPSPARGEGSLDRPLHLEITPRRLAVLSIAPEGPPVKFQYAGRDESIVRAWGPERIETGWWRGGCVRRDYYQVETASGQRYWLFRELHTGGWFLHGKFF